MKTATTTQMMLLSQEDFKGFKFNTDQSAGIDVLAQVCCVALEKFNRLKQQQQQQHHQNINNLGFPQQPQPQSENQEKASSLKKTIKIVRREKKEAAHDDHDHDQEYQETHYHSNHGLNLRKTTSKRSRYDDNEDDDWEHNVDPMKKKKQKNDPKSRSRRIVRGSNFVRPAPMDPYFVPDLPEIFRRRIDEMQGTGITLVIQKQLTDTDLSPDHNRLSIPFAHVKDWDFLTEIEKARLRARGIMEVPLIEPEPVMKLTNMNLTQWDMAKPSGKKSSMYVLRTAWKLVVKDNHLLPYEIAQVWSFRVQGTLHMALVVISRRPPPPAVGMASTSGGSSSGGSDGAGSSGSSGSGNGTESGSGQIASQFESIEAASPA